MKFSLLVNSEINSLERVMLATNRGILAKIHLIFSKKINLLRQRLLLSEDRPSSSKRFCLDVLPIAPVVVKHALY